MFEAFKLHGHLFGMGPIAIFALWVLTIVVDAICIFVMVCMSDDINTPRKHYNIIFSILAPSAIGTIFLTLYGLS